MKDCIHRKEYRCLKLGKPVAIDKRDEEGDICWGQRFCDDYDSGVREEEIEIEEEKKEPIEESIQIEKKEEEKVSKQEMLF